MSNHNPPTNGFDKRKHQINRLGRPKTFDTVRELAQQIAHEIAQAGGQDVIINGHKVTIVEAILRQWAMSKNPQMQRAFIEVAFGKVPDGIIADVIQKITVEYINNDTNEFSEPTTFD